MRSSSILPVRSSPNVSGQCVAMRNVVVIELLNRVAADLPSANIRNVLHDGISLAANLEKTRANLSTGTCSDMAFTERPIHTAWSVAAASAARLRAPISLPYIFQPVPDRGVRK